MNWLLKLEDVTTGYDDKIIVKNVDLTIYEKDFLGIIGPNGCGKTTLLKIIMGLLEPVEGKLIYAESRPKIGYLPQFLAKDKKFPISAFDVVLSGTMCLNNKIDSCKDTKENIKRANELFEKLGIKGLENQNFGTLSGGQMQRIFLARALISSPELLVLDEPTTFVDTVFTKGFYEHLAELNSQMAIILVSHELGVISSHVKNIACINKTIHYHSGNDLSREVLDHYECPIDILGHGDIPHRVLRKHGDN
ncbi:ABC transporter ATP-binding protein [bacterium]|nr:ABC transporter ATP-binding protein [bacterium]